MTDSLSRAHEPLKVNDLVLFFLPAKRALSDFEMNIGFSVRRQGSSIPEASAVRLVSKPLALLRILLKIQMQVIKESRCQVSCRKKHTVPSEDASASSAILA